MVVEVADHAVGLRRSAPAEFSGEIGIPDVACWWPHTHGAPHRYPLRLRFGDTVCDLGSIGFRDVRQRGEDGFALTVNGDPVFCRGACWTSPDIVALPGDADSYRPWLLAARDAGMNMIRVGGTMAYESDAFFALCDELGLMVWQDAMLANFDYPATDAFRDLLSAELSAFLDRTQTNASLAVVCGGSEVLQQAAMLGLPPEKIDVTLYTEVIPAALARAAARCGVRAELAQRRRLAVPAERRRGTLLRRRGLSPAAGGRTSRRCEVRLGMPGAGQRALHANHGSAGRCHDHRSAMETHRAARSWRRLGFRGRARSLPGAAVRR